MSDKSGIEIESKSIRLSKKKKEEEMIARIQDLKRENKELIITLVEECVKEQDDYRDIDEERVEYFVVISKCAVDENQIKVLLEEKTEYKRRYREYDYSIKKYETKHNELKNIKKNTFGFSQEATDDNGEFTYTYSLVESKEITSERLAELIKPSFLFHLDTPKLYSISDDEYRKLFFNASRIGKQVIPIINGIGKDELDSLVVWLKKELKF
jgi:hypothetical protein